MNPPDCFRLSRRIPETGVASRYSPNLQRCLIMHFAKKGTLTSFRPGSTTISEILLEESQSAGNTSHIDSILSSSRVFTFRITSASTDGYTCWIWSAESNWGEGLTDRHRPCLQREDVELLFWLSSVRPWKPQHHIQNDGLCCPFQWPVSESELSKADRTSFHINFRRQPEEVYNCSRDPSSNFRNSILFFVPIELDIWYPIIT